MKNEELNKTKEELKTIIEKAGFKLVVVFKGVSRSGMLRRFSVYAFVPNDEQRIKAGYGAVDKYWLNYKIADVCRTATFDKKDETLKISGCGMDMAFHLISSLSRVLYDDDYKITHDLI